MYPKASAGLVRSIAVDEAWRGCGLGTRLTEWVLQRAESLGLTQLYLFTMAAREFFARFSFAEVTLDDFPAGGAQVGPVPRRAALPLGGARGDEAQCAGLTASPPHCTIRPALEGMLMLSQPNSLIGPRSLLRPIAVGGGLGAVGGMSVPCGGPEH